MKKVRLGKTRFTVSRVGKKGIPIPRPPINESAKKEEKVIELGVNSFDTSIGARTSDYTHFYRLRLLDHLQDEMIVEPIPRDTQQ